MAARFSALLPLALLLVGCAPRRYPVTVETNVPMKARDGVALLADIYRPDVDGKFPVILERTPYDKRSPGGMRNRLALAAEGYVYVRQDVRGRFESEGEWAPLVHDAEDGFDTVEWAAALPCSNGRVGMTGGSYQGSAQLLAAVLAPPHLVSICPYVAPCDFHAHWAYQGGAFHQAGLQAWTTRMAIGSLECRLRKEAKPWKETLRPLPDFPILEPGKATGLADWYFDYLNHPDDDAFWKRIAVPPRFDRIQVPAFHIGGWYDFFLAGTLQGYTGIRDHGGSEAARKGQRLLIVPGGHAGRGPKIGDVDFGKDSVADIAALTLRWFDWTLKGIDNGMAREKPVRIFVMGLNVWRDEDDWPLERAKPTRFYLRSDGKANTLHGDGRLSAEPPGSEPPDRYVYDPDDPVPTRGGAGDSGLDPKLPAGPVDQRSAQDRPDVLVYTMPPFDKDTEVTGPVSLELYASSSALDTDFVAKLIDVHPDGFARNLAEGILRARYRDSFEKPALLKPGQVYKLTIDLWATSNVFLAGHRLQVEISSSKFPHFDRNPNTGESPEAATRMIKAENVIHHDRDHPSCLIAPVVP